METALSSCPSCGKLFITIQVIAILSTKNNYRKKPHLASSQHRKIQLYLLSDTQLKPTKICGQVATQFYMGVKERMISVKRQM
jgi:hypothetical protein